MKPKNKFLGQPKHFWAYVRSVSEQVGYTERKKINKGRVKIPSILEIKNGLEKRDLNPLKVIKTNGTPTKFGDQLLEYFEYRANILNDYVEPRLMDLKRAKKEFNRLHKKLSPNAPIPMNKQKKEKKSPAYFTGIINMLIEANLNGLSCDYDPKRLTTITKDGFPLRTLARRVDGAFPTTTNPLAIWEIKEYYYTTTFGSRVADGVYETLLDGMELQELFSNQKIKIYHYMMVDAHYTWWGMGKSYLCRMIDMLHMGLVDEVLFGYEVIERLPIIVKEWGKSLTK